MTYGKFYMWSLLALVSGSILFHTSYKTQQLEEQLNVLNRKIIAQQETIKVLRAEWGYLTEFSRLEKLSQAHLDLQPTKAVQFASFDDIPKKVPVDNDGVKLSITPKQAAAHLSPATKPTHSLVLARYEGAR